MTCFKNALGFVYITFRIKGKVTEKSAFQTWVEEQSGMFKGRGCVSSALSILSKSLDKFSPDGKGEYPSRKALGSHCKFTLEPTGMIPFTINVNYAFNAEKA